MTPFSALVDAHRAELHRYCARLVGSAIDGEDVVQETLAKAQDALQRGAQGTALRPWLFRIAYTTSLDFLRQYDRRFVEPVAEVPEEALVATPQDPEVVRAALSSFMALPVSQRSAVILKDILDCSLEEIAEATGTTVMAVKAALVRGRAKLKAQAQPEVVPWRDRPETPPADRVLLQRYVRLFNSRDWDGLRALLSEESRLEMVSRATRRGKAVGEYFHNYAALPPVRLEVGLVEGRHAIGAFRTPGATRPDYVILQDWKDGKLSFIRDYLYVPYIGQELEFEPIPPTRSAS